jgi:sirohydrochlorin cobaltochelatase
MQPGIGKKKKNATVLLLSLGLLLLVAGLAQAAQNRPPERKAIVLAVFGTTHPDALSGILSIRDAVSRAFPEVPVRLAFTSSIIRRIWRERRENPDYDRAGVEPEILGVKGPLATVADLIEEGYGYVIVQPTHISSGEEFSDLASSIRALNSIETVKERNRPFRKILLGRPAFGTYGIAHSYRRDIDEVAGVLAADAERARGEGRALVYLAHGNEHYSTGAYLEFEHVMRRRYQEIDTYVAMVEGFPGFDLLAARLAEDRARKVLLKPLMTVAGEHAKRDMAGPGPDSLKSLLEGQGIEVTAELTGLGELEGFAQIFIDHIREAAADEGLRLQ